jgi:hypothetical protein
MIVDPGAVTMAKRNGRTARNLDVPPGGKPINEGQVVDLLAGRASPRAQPGARDLLREMALRDWVVTAAAHPGGFGGDPAVRHRRDGARPGGECPNGGDRRDRPA